jgi:hypothetical protein
LQNWHLYFFSGTKEVFRPAVGDAAMVFKAVTGMAAMIPTLQDDG